MNKVFLLNNCKGTVYEHLEKEQSSISLHVGSSEKKNGLLSV